VSRSGVVTGGTWCCDHNKLVPYWPAEDGLVPIISEARRGGGPGCNMAVDLKKLDPDLFVETIGVVGDDDDGRILVAEADAYGIERSQLAVTSDVSTNYTDAYASKASGRRIHIYFEGTNAVLSPDHFDFGRTRARILHLGLPGIHRLMDAPSDGDASGWVTVLRKAREAGLETNMELASVGREKLAELVRPCLPHLDLLVVNDFEIGAIAETTTVVEGRTNVESCVEAAKTVMARGGLRLVAVHFPGGAIVLDRQGGVPRMKPSVDVPAEAVIGANGAGDAFAAGILYGLHENWPLDDAIALAHATAAASLRSMGTTDAVVDWRQCLQLANRWGWRNKL
jgi:sugar/nucleoside kinase (ribokinase family)